MASGALGRHRLGGLVVVARGQQHDAPQGRDDHRHGDADGDQTLLLLRAARLLGDLLEPELTVGLLSFTLGGAHESGRLLPIGGRWTSPTCSVVSVALIVQKYGGTSVADPDRMRAVAENVAFTKRHGNDVVVVVSAMGRPPTTSSSSPTT